jgi:hypothetical protein
MTGIKVEGKPTETVAVQKIKVGIPQPFAEGHKLRANEADALNAHYINCIRNTVAGAVKDMIGEGDASQVDPKQVQKIVDEAIKEYDFGQSRAGRPGDPVKQEAMEIARNIVRQQLQKKGHKLSDIAGKTISEHANKLLQHEAHGPKIMEKAKAVVAERQSLAEMELDL